MDANVTDMMTVLHTTEMCVIHGKARHRTPGFIALWVTIELSLVHFFIQLSVEGSRKATDAYKQRRFSPEGLAPNGSKKGREGPLWGSGWLY
jgi:hypothetical protein